MRAWSFIILGFVDRARGDTHAAINHFVECRDRFVELDSPFGACQASLELGRCYVEAGRWALAVEELRNVLDSLRERRYTANVADVMELLVIIAKA